MPQSQRTNTINAAVDWLLGKLAKAQQRIEQSDSIDDAKIPKRVTIRDIIRATGTMYQTLKSYGIYAELEARFNCLTYRENHAEWLIDPEKISDDIERGKELKIND